MFGRSFWRGVCGNPRNEYEEFRLLLKGIGWTGLSPISLRANKVTHAPDLYCNPFHLLMTIVIFTLYFYKWTTLFLASRNIPGIYSSNNQFPVATLGDVILFFMYPMTVILVIVNVFRTRRDALNYFRLLIRIDKLLVVNGATNIDQTIFKRTNWKICQMLVSYFVLIGSGVAASSIMRSVKSNTTAPFTLILLIQVPQCLVILSTIKTVGCLCAVRHRFDVLADLVRDRQKTKSTRPWIRRPALGLFAHPIVY